MTNQEENKWTKLRFTSTHSERTWKDLLYIANEGSKKTFVIKEVFFYAFTFNFWDVERILASSLIASGTQFWEPSAVGDAEAQEGLGCVGQIFLYLLKRNPSVT